MHAGRSRKDRITKKCDSDKLSATIDIKLDDDNDDDLLDRSVSKLTLDS